MSQVKYRTVNFNDMFELKRGQVISKEDINKSKGEYPVYSTQVEEALGSIDSFMYDGNYLIWNTDGLAGYIKVTDGKFSITNIVGIMLLKEPYTLETISLQYIKHILEPIFRSHKKGRMGQNGKNEYTKLNSTMIKQLNIVVPIPIKQDGTFDIEAQIEIAKKYELLKRKKKELITQKELIESICVDFFSSKPTKSIEINKVCDVISENHIYTKAYINKHPGEYPVYSATIKEPFGFLNCYNFDEEVLMFVNYGINAGMTYLVNGKYSIGRNVCGLKINEKYKNSVLLDYIQIIQTPKFISLAKGELHKNLNQGMVKDATITFPVKLDGTFDLEAQKEIVNKYKKIETIKRNLINEIDKLISKEIVIE